MARAVDGVSLCCFRIASWRRFLVRLLFAPAVLWSSGSPVFPSCWPATVSLQARPGLGAAALFLR
jgi:hypothetical protein